ncbi:hypothetical protein [Rhizobium sp. 42MFCr.1]|uniref:hypothetical protein n=1 Tax=Rhizobium sp. 42MFCr.1 TaxID=1048680 RepID=UPI0012EB7173|nr:hypothetical protein [Rhizobium sp. 42MFCr.1]
MSGFKRTNQTGVFVHVGDPSCDAAHQNLLIRLQKMGAPFDIAATEVGSRIKGNLGEFIALHVALGGPYGAMQKHIGNALQPLSRISGPGLDLIYVHFDAFDSSLDRLYIQEIKTTGDVGLGYLDNLKSDYKKLFAPDPQFTLQTRISALANKFELEQNNAGYAERVIKLGGTTPQESVRVQLMPTGIHDLASSDPVAKMLMIRSSIMGFGWNSVQIEPWSIGLSSLEKRLLRLLKGQQ